PRSEFPGITGVLHRRVGAFSNVHPGKRLSVAQPASLPVSQCPEDAERFGPGSKAAHILGSQTVSLQNFAQLGWTNEHPPVVNIRRHYAGPAPLLQQPDGNHSARGRAVEGVVEVYPSRLEYAGCLGNHQLEVSHVLEHVATVRDVEAAGIEGKGLSRCNLV